MPTVGNVSGTTSIAIPLPSDLRYGYTAFIDELKALEEVYYPSIMDRSLTQIIADQYTFLLTRTRNYANYGMKLSGNNELTNLDNKDIAILNYVHSAILSRLNQLKSSDSSDLTIDILGFIKIIESNITNLAKQQQIEKIDFYKKGYKSQIEQKIAEANSFIQQLQTAIEQYYKEIDDDFKNLLKETEDLKADAKHNVQELKQKKAKLKKQLPLKLIFGSLKVLTSVLAFTGPQGALVGSLIDSGSNIAQGFTLNDNSGNKLPLSSIPEGASSFISEYKNYSDTTKKRREEEAKERIDIIKDILKENPNELLSQPLKDVVKKSAEIEAEINKLIEEGAEYDPASVMRKYDLQKDFSEALIAERNAIEQKEASESLIAERNAIEQKIKSDDKNYKNSKAWIEKAQKLANIASAGVKIYNICKEHDSAIDEIENAIGENEETIKKLDKFEDKVDTFSQQTIVNMKGSVTSLQESLSTKSHIALDVEKWKMQAYLKDIKHELDKMTAGFKAQSDFIHVFEKVSNAIATLVDIYDRIQNYQEQAQLVDYIANVSSAGVMVDYQEINELKVIILQNTILERYSALISAVKQWAFPFAHNFFRDFNFMLNVASDRRIDVNTLNVVNNIEKLKDKVEKYNATISKMDTRILKDDFGLDSTKPPFCIWKRDIYADVIKKLLNEGSKQRESEEVVLPSISSVQSLFSYSAVKFNRIELHIKHIDPAKQPELNACLSNFNVYLTHSTDSYYRFNNRYYQCGGNLDLDSNISDDFNRKLLLVYGYDKNTKKISYTRNNAYDKLFRGELMLSPYSIWYVKLVLIKSASRSCFFDLDKYSEFVDLELVGKGSYVDEDQMLDDEKKALLVDFYYQPVDIFPIIADQG
jgi:hypothetical protein